MFICNVVVGCLTAPRQCGASPASALARNHSNLAFRCVVSYQTQYLHFTDLSGTRFSPRDVILSYTDLLPNHVGSPIVYAASPTILDLTTE